MVCDSYSAKFSCFLSIEINFCKFAAYCKKSISLLVIIIKCTDDIAIEQLKSLTNHSENAS